MTVSKSYPIKRESFTTSSYYLTIESFRDVKKAENYSVEMFIESTSKYLLVYAGLKVWGTQEAIVLLPLPPSFDLTGTDVTNLFSF